MTSPVALWTIWDSRNKYCSSPASKLNFSSRKKKTGLHIPHFYTCKEEQVSTRASWKYPVKLPCTGHISGLVLLSLTKAIPHNYFHLIETSFGGCGGSYEYQKYFLWVGRTSPPPPICSFCRLWSTEAFFGTSYSKAVIYLKFQPFFLLLLFPTHTSYPGYLECWIPNAAPFPRLKTLPDQSSSSFITHYVPRISYYAS